MIIILYLLFLPNIFILFIALLAREWTVFSAALVAIFYNAVLVYLVNEKEVSETKLRRFQDTSDRRYDKLKSEFDELKMQITKNK